MDGCFEGVPNNEGILGAMCRNAAHTMAVAAVLAMAGFAQDPSLEADSTPVEVTGTVVNSSTGQPIAGASVVLNAGFQFPRAPQFDPGNPGAQPLARNMPPKLGEHQTSSDDGGKFSFQTVLGPGWSVSVSHRGYRAPGGQRNDVAVMNGMGQTKPDSLSIKLDPLGLVEGKLVNEDGEPLPGVSVELWISELVDGRRNIRRDATKSTDDQGAYRLWDISPGSYYLKVSGRRGTGVAAAETPRPSNFLEAYGPVYFPNSPDLEGARIIKLAPGEAFHADFEVPAQRAYRVHGNFTSPIANRRVTLRLLRGDDETGNRSGVNPGAATFDLFDVTPGRYTLQAWTNDAGTTLFGETQISVGSSDLNGVPIALSPAVTLEGKADPAGQMGTLQITANYSNVRRLPSALNSAVTGFVDEDGRFKLEPLWPGRYDLTTQYLIKGSFNPSPPARSICSSRGS